MSYAVYYDYTGAGRRPEPVAGPFETLQEAEDYLEEEYPNDTNYFTDAVYED